MRSLRTMAFGLTIVGLSLTVIPGALTPARALADVEQPNPPAIAAGGEQAGLPAQPTVVELPVTRAELFSSGVGYFEHDGQIDGNATLRLHFKTDQINDVLKSLVVMDEDGGTVSSITYPSNDPVARSLKSFGVDLSGSPSLPDILRQLRGAAVSITTPDKITGSILGVDERTMVVGQPSAQITEYRLNLVTASGIRSIPLNTISTIALDDPRLQDELNKALAMLTASRDTESKPVELRLIGQGKRHVRVGYLVETPVWKTSYRLDLSGKPLLQGWAIVENTSDTDWSNVGMSLVSGRPISFVMDLYTPLYLRRPEMRPQLWGSLEPHLYDEGIQGEANENAPEAASAAVAGMMTGGPISGANQMKAALWRPGTRTPGAMGKDGTLDMLSERDWKAVALQSAQAQAAGATVGELFTYNLANPVDMPRHRSAMLPIIDQNITAEKVSIYNQATLADHPLNGVYLTNDTTLKMLGGPITVLDGGAYAGDAMIDYLAPGDRRLLSYAIDLAMTVDPSVKEEQNLTEVKIVRGVLRVTRMNSFTQLYTIRNKADAPRKLIVEHPFINGRELIEPAKYEEKTPSVYRFAVQIEANKTARFVVKEQEPVLETIAILDYPPEALNWYVRAAHVAPEVKEALAKAIALKQELAEMEAGEQALRRQLDEIDQDEDRIRKNIDATGRDSTSGQHYVEDLRAHEDRFDQVKKDRAELQKQIEAKRKELADYLNGLSAG